MNWEIVSMTPFETFRMKIPEGWLYATRKMYLNPPYIVFVPSIHKC